MCATMRFVAGVGYSVEALAAEHRFFGRHNVVQAIRIRYLELMFSRHRPA
jgi:hypothetical protein